MTNYDVTAYNYTSAQDYRNRGMNGAKIAGATLLGGMVGMTGYHFPVNKNAFVNEAFNVTKKNTQADIVSLKMAATEVANTGLSNDSKILLRRLGVAENYDAILDKCKTLNDSITDSAAVKNLKSTFETGFKSFKKQASLMDNNAAEAMSNLRWNGFYWGMALGAGVGLALGLINSNKE